ncbi:outer membrane beta-barrel family protein [Nibrella saemangeumensis]|uniref:Outer membrane beta-barrel family protein n=1 Tax=Nibrella saemangeumensis TaxID=1084526 RepID=A0ABP8MME0_9BACT
MKRLLLWLGVTLLTSAAIAQIRPGAPTPVPAPRAGSSAFAIGEVVGSVVDSVDGKPVPYASLALLNADNRLVIGVITDDLGELSFVKLPNGRYRLSISCIGYEAKMLNNLLITDNRPTVDIGRIRLRPDRKTLKEVVVTAQRALLEDKGDRLVYNAEKDIAAGGGTAADVLRRIPMLSVDMNGNVKLRGNPKIKVLLNGKPSGLLARNLAEALRQIPGSQIKSVEVITSPGARYDAEGTAGVINIITRRPRQGINGGLNGSLGNLVRSAGGYGSIQGRKLGLYLTGGYYEYRTIAYADVYRTSLQNGQPINTLYQRIDQDNTGTGGNAEVSLDYDIDSTARLSLWLYGWGGNWPNNSRVHSLLTDTRGRTMQEFQQDIRYLDTYRNGEVNLAYTKTFQRTQSKPVIGPSAAGPAIRSPVDKSLKPELSVMMQRSNIPDKYIYTAEQSTMSEVVTYRERSLNLSRNNEFTVQSDFTYPFRVRNRRDTTLASAEIGAKAILRDIGSDFSLEQATNGSTNYQPNPNRSDVFDYLQQVYAAYTSLRMAKAGKWSINAGGRLERTYLDGNFFGPNSALNRQYQNLIPSFTFSRTFNDKHTFRLSYTQRIARPVVWYLNPFINSSNPKYLITGNPELNPELTHSPEFSYSLFTKKGLFINSALYYQRTDNAIDYLLSMDVNGISLWKPQNIAQRTFYGLQVSANGQPVKNMNLSGGGNLQWADLTSAALSQRNQGWVWSATANLSYRIGKGFTVQADGNYNAGAILLQGKSLAWYSYTVSAKKELWNKRASVVVTANTPFHHEIRQDTYLDTPAFTSFSRNATVTRSARIFFYWQFGQSNTGTGRQRKQITNDDKAGSRTSNR